MLALNMSFAVGVDISMQRGRVAAEEAVLDAVLVSVSSDIHWHDDLFAA